MITNAIFNINYKLLKYFAIINNKFKFNNISYIVSFSCSSCSFFMSRETDEVKNEYKNTKISQQKNIQITLDELYKDNLTGNLNRVIVLCYPFDYPFDNRNCGSSSEQTSSKLITAKIYNQLLHCLKLEKNRYISPTDGFEIRTEQLLNAITYIDNRKLVAAYKLLHKYTDIFSSNVYVLSHLFEQFENWQKIHPD